MVTEMDDLKLKPQHSAAGGVGREKERERLGLLLGRMMI